MDDLSALSREELIERLVAMGRQRDTLIREAHHRIKNHLQGITGLLYNRAAERPEIAAVLIDAIRQIGVVAQVYGMQSRAGMDGVRLCDLIAMAAEGAAGPVAAICECATHGRTAPLAEKEAVPIALVVNELIANAVKHLNPPVPERPVRVNAEIGEDAVTVEIRNAPARLPADFDFQAGRGCGTGLELVRALLSRQGAVLTYRQEGDAVVTTLRLAPPVVRISVAEPLSPAASAAAPAAAGRSAG